MKNSKLSLLAVFGLATGSYTSSHAQTWNLTGGGNWDDNANWTATYPDAASATVVINPSSGGTISNSGTDTSFTLNNLALGGTANNNTVTIGSASTLVFANPTPVLNFVNGTSSTSSRNVQAAINATASGLSIRAGGASGSVDAVNTISSNINATGQTVSFDNSTVSGIVGQRIISMTGNITAANLNNTRTASTLILQGANTISGSALLSGAGGTTLIRRSDAGSTTAAAITPFGTAGVTLSGGHRLSNSVTGYSNSIILANTVTLGTGGGIIDVGGSGDSFVLGDAANDLTGNGNLTVTSQSTSNPTSTNLDGISLVLGYSNNLNGTVKLGSGSTSGYIDAIASGATGTGALEFAGTGNMAIRTSKTGGNVQLNNTSWSITGNGGTILIGGDSGSTTRFTGTFSNTGNSTLNLGRNSAYGTSGGDQTIDLQGIGSLSNNMASTGTTTVRLLLSNTSGTQAFSGNLSTGSGAGALRVERNGAGGTTILSGTNTYTGTTTVTAGTLLANGTHTGGGNYSVASGGVLGGTGTISAAINVTGVLAPGASIESLGSGTLTFNSGSTYAYEINTSTVGADLQFVTGNLNFDGTVTLNLTELGSMAALTVGTKFTLISYTGTWDGDVFSGYADDSNFTFAGNDWIINYNDSAGGSNFTTDQTGASGFVTMTVIPEPRAALLGGLGLLALLRRRRA